MLEDTKTRCYTSAMALPRGLARQVHEDLRRLRWSHVLRALLDVNMLKDSILCDPSHIGLGLSTQPDMIWNFWILGYGRPCAQ